MHPVIETFKTIAKIPKCSFHADKMRDFLVEYAKNEGFVVETDSAGNILAKKEPSKVCLQAHYDIVCIGDAENIEVVEEGGCLKAKNSSLGADNCVAVAYMMELMKRHKDVEYLFTADEEVGLVGAKALELNLSSKYLLNIDSEKEGDISLGCAGGYEVTADFALEFADAPSDGYFYEISSKNFKGGHSGIDIDKGIKSALKELAFLLQKMRLSLKNTCSTQSLTMGAPKLPHSDPLEQSVSRGFLESSDAIRLCSFGGGERLNSIPVGAKAVICSKEPLGLRHANFDMREIEKQKKIIKNGAELLNLLCAAHSGVLDFDRSYDVVSNSINLSKVAQGEEFVRFELMGRANSDEAMEKNIIQTKSLFELAKCQNIDILEKYPAWTPKMSDFAKIVKSVFEKKLGRAEYVVYHAGFECGVLISKFPQMEAVSIGPNIHNPHSKSERVEIESMILVYEAIEEILKAL